MRLLSVLFTLIISAPAIAGELNDFENSATKPKQSGSSSASSSPSRSSESYGSSRSSSGSMAGELIGAILRPIVAVTVEHIVIPVVEKTIDVAVDGTKTVLANGTEGSYEKSRSRLGIYPDIPDLSEDAESDLGVPLLQLDVGYGIGDKIQWRDTRGEAGYGPFSVFYRQSQYIEPTAGDKLDIVNLGFNYRLFYGSRTELNFGFGNYKLTGNKTYKSGSLQFALNHQIKENLSFDYSRVSVSGENLNLADSEFALIYGKDHWYARFFYRTMDTTDTSLDGVGVGLTLIY